MMLYRTRKPQQGLTLIELMIALVLGLVIVAAVTQLFLSNRQAYRLAEAQSRLQDNARFAVELLSRDVRSAGFSGCRTIENMNVVTVANAPIPATINNTSIISGGNAQGPGSWSPSPSGLLGTLVDGTDYITVQHGDSCGGNLVGNVTSSNANIQVFAPNTCDLQANDVLMIADCEDAHIFRATSVSNGTGQQTVAHGQANNEANHFCKTYPSLPHSGACNTGDAKLYGHDSEILKFSATTYFIRLGTNGQPALWSYEIGSAVATELVEGVENLQVLYGADDNGDDIVDRYVDAKVIDDAGDWDVVISAEIRLLLVTGDQNVTTDVQAVNYNGATVNMANGRLGRAVTTTIGIRNRVQ